LEKKNEEKQKVQKFKKLIYEKKGYGREKILKNNHSEIYLGHREGFLNFIL
jgi:hypothetical protein